MSEIRKLGLPAKLGIGFALGLVVGLIFQFAGISGDIVKPFGDLFIRLIRMVIVPLIFATLVVGAASMGDARKLGSIASKTLAWFFCTTAIATAIGLFFANVLKPGVGLNLSTAGLVAEDFTPPSFVDILLDIVPLNPVQALAEANLLQIIFFAILFGFALNALGEKGKPLLNIFQIVSDIMIRLVNTVMKYSPIGVFALITFTVADQGLGILLPLIKVIGVMYVAAIAHVILVYLIPLKLFTGRGPIGFIKAISEPLLVAFTTTASAAALPLNLKATQEYGASKDVSSFAIPLGNSINQDGAAIYLGIAAVFLAQLYGIPLGIFEQLTVLVIAVLASMGSGGVPSSALIVMTMVFTAVGLPLEGVALVAGIDRIMDMARTTLNIFGDATGTIIVSKLEGELGEPEPRVA